jgi:selenium metabolism protein YedF
MKLIDTRGKICPEPLILVKTALKEMKPPLKFHVLVDNEMSKDNLLSFFRDNHITVHCYKEFGYWIIITHLDETIPNITYQENSENTKPFTNDYIIVIKSNKFGNGDEALSEILMKSYLHSLSILSTLPKKIIFFNSGVFLLKNKIDTSRHIQTLIDLNVEIIACGACVEYYNLQNQLILSSISNMLSIVETIQQSEKVLYL